MAVLRSGLEGRLVGKNHDIPASNVVWDSEYVTKTADEILAATDDVAGPRQSAVQEAVEWVQELMAGGAMQATLVQAEAEAAGLSWATVRRAKKVAGVETYREGGKGKAGHWFWRLPSEEPLRCSTDPYDAQEKDVSTLRKFEHLSASEAADTADAATRAHRAHGGNGQGAVADDDLTIPKCLDRRNESACDHCGRPGGRDCAYDGNSLRLHSDCERPWRQAYEARRNGGMGPSP